MVADGRNPKRGIWWWGAAILTPIGILGGPVAGADLLAGIIEWRGPIPYILAFWHEHISAPIGTILGFLATVLALPQPSEFLADYITLSLLLAGSFIRVRRLMHPTESLAESRTIIQEGLEPPMRRIPGAQKPYPDLPADLRSHGEARPDVIVLGATPEDVVIGTRAAGAYDKIGRAFKPLSRGAFAGLIVASAVAWPVALIAQLYLLLKDLCGWAALKWNLSKVTPTGVAWRAASSRDRRLIDFTREQLIQRAMRFTLALSPFLLFLLLCALNIAFLQHGTVAPAPGAEMNHLIGIALASVALLVVWLAHNRVSDAQSVQRALQRADAKLRVRRFDRITGGNRTDDKISGRREGGG